MRRERFYNDLGYNDRPRRGRTDFYRRGERFYHREDLGRGLHILGGRRDGLGPHLDEGCNTEENVVRNRAYKYKFYNTDSTRKTKMFSSKSELLDYVNKVGETGLQVDIFKIEEELYKVVVYGEIKEQE